MKMILAVFAVLVSLLPSRASAQAQDGQYTQLVATTKAALEAKGVNLAGACGAFEITKRVAWQLRGQGFGFLHKAGGNRAVPQPDGSCKSGDESSDPEGYATDYLISMPFGVGYDILGDGGGKNIPQFAGPENAKDMVARNLGNFRAPFDPDPLPLPVVTVGTPADRAADVEPTIAIGWFGDATSYDLAFGTVNPPAVVARGLVTGTYKPAERLKDGTIYFWQVTGHNAAGATVSPMQSFSTAIVVIPSVDPVPVVDPVKPVEPSKPIVLPKATTFFGHVRNILILIAAGVGAIVFCSQGACN